jgi:hypothetical protein
MRKYRIKETVYVNMDGNPERRYDIQSRALLLAWEHHSRHDTIEQTRATLHMLNDSKVYYD